MLHAVFLLLVTVSNPARGLTLWMTVRRGSCTSRALLGGGAGVVTGGPLAEDDIHDQLAGDQGV